MTRNNLKRQRLPQLNDQGSFLHFQVLSLPQKLPTCSRTQNNCSKQANEELKCHSKRDAVVMNGVAFHWSLRVTHMLQNLSNKKMFVQEINFETILFKIVSQKRNYNFGGSCNGTITDFHLLSFSDVSCV